MFGLFFSSFAYFIAQCLARTTTTTGGDADERTQTPVDIEAAANFLHAANLVAADSLVSQIYPRHRLYKLPVSRIYLVLASHMALDGLCRNKPIAVS